jgi:hypothetical protein
MLHMAPRPHVRFGTQSTGKLQLTFTIVYSVESVMFVTMHS